MATGVANILSLFFLQPVVLSRDWTHRQNNEVKQLPVP
jgi:hypothetical protein